MAVFGRKRVESEEGRVPPTRMKKLQSLVCIEESESESESSSIASISDLEDSNEKNLFDVNVSEEIEEIPRTATQRFVVDDLMQFSALSVCARPKGVITMPQLPIIIPTTGGWFYSEASLDWFKERQEANPDIWKMLSGGYGINMLFQPKDASKKEEWAILPYTSYAFVFAWTNAVVTGAQFTVGYVVGFALKFPIFFFGISTETFLGGALGGAAAVSAFKAFEPIYEFGMVIVSKLVVVSASVGIDLVSSTALIRLFTYTLFGNWLGDHRRGHMRVRKEMGDLTVTEFMRDPKQLFERFNGLLSLLWISLRATSQAHYSCVALATESMKQIFLVVSRKKEANVAVSELVKRVTEIKLLELCSLMGVGITWVSLQAIFIKEGPESMFAYVWQSVGKRMESTIDNVVTLKNAQAGFMTGLYASGTFQELLKHYFNALTHVVMDTRGGIDRKHNPVPDPLKTWEQTNNENKIGAYSFGFLYHPDKKVLLGKWTPKSYFEYIMNFLSPTNPYASGNPFVDIRQPNSFKHLDEKATLFPGKDVLWFDIPKEWSEQIHGLELDNVLWLHDIMVWIRGGKIAPKETVHMVTGLMQYTPGFMALTRFHWMNTLGFGAILVAGGVMTARWLALSIRWRRLLVKVTINLSLREKIREATKTLRTIENGDPTIKHKVHKMERFESMLADLAPSLLDADRGQTTYHSLCLIRQGHTRLGIEGLKDYGRWVGQIWTPDMFFRESYLYLRRMFRRIIEEVADWSKTKRGMAAVFAVATMWVASPALARIIGKDILIEGMFWIARGFFATNTYTVNVGHLQYIHWGLKAVAKVFGKTAVGNMVQVIPNMVDMADRQARHMVYALGAGMYYLLYGPPRNASIFNALEPRYAARRIIAGSKRGRSLLGMVSASALDLIHPWTVLKLLWRVGPWRLSILSTIVKMILGNTGTIRQIVQLVSM